MQEIVQITANTCDEEVGSDKSILDICKYVKLTYQCSLKGGHTVLVVVKLYQNLTCINCCNYYTNCVDELICN